MLNATAIIIDPPSIVRDTTQFLVDAITGPMVKPRMIPAERDAPVTPWTMDLWLRGNHSAANLGPDAVIGPQPRPCNPRRKIKPIIDVPHRGRSSAAIVSKEQNRTYVFANPHRSRTIPLIIPLIATINVKGSIAAAVADPKSVFSVSEIVPTNGVGPIRAIPCSE